VAYASSLFYILMYIEALSDEIFSLFLQGLSILLSRKRKMSGFGHRVYKNYDPRAKVIRKLAEEVFSIMGRDPLIEVSFTHLFNRRHEIFSEALFIFWFEPSFNVE
jgi:hypothetical protein